MISLKELKSFSILLTSPEMRSTPLLCSVIAFLAHSENVAEFCGSSASSDKEAASLIITARF
jgi:hypothetical protein